MIAEITVQLSTTETHSIVGIIGFTLGLIGGLKAKS